MDASKIIKKQLISNNSSSTIEQQYQEDDTQQQQQQITYLSHDNCKYMHIHQLKQINYFNNKNIKQKLSIFKRLINNSFARDVLLWLIIIIIFSFILCAVYFIIKQRAASENGSSSMLNFEISSTNNGLFTNKVYLLDENQSASRAAYQLEENETFLKRKFLRNDSLVCNDGTPAGFYIRKSLTNSKTWIILLEGGNFCNDVNSCLARLQNSPDLASSKRWSLFKNGDGILSASKVENKYWWNANVVLIPYCSSDLWLGRQKANCKFNCTKDFHFMGHEIFFQVIDDLINNYSMNESQQVILSGMSAGGIGVLMNIDEIQQKLQKTIPNTKLKAIIDSSWILDLPYMSTCKSFKNIEECPISRLFSQTLKFWNAYIPIDYLNLFNNPWDALLPYKIYPYIKTPLFIIQSLFDETQFIDQPNLISTTEDEYEINEKKLSNIEIYINRITDIRTKLIESFSQVHSYYIPACISHMILTRSDWYLFEINNKYLIDVLYCWTNSRYEKQTRHNHNPHKHHKHKIDKKSQSIAGKYPRNSDNNKKCLTKIIDNCKWPNCNRSCPNIKHPLTGEEINPIDLFNFYENINNFNYKKLWRHISEKRLSKVGYQELMKRYIP